MAMNVTVRVIPDRTTQELMAILSGRLQRAWRMSIFSRGDQRAIEQTIARMVQAQTQIAELQERLINAESDEHDRIRSRIAGIRVLLNLERQHLRILQLQAQQGTVLGRIFRGLRTVWQRTWGVFSSIYTPIMRAYWTLVSFYYMVGHLVRPIATLEYALLGLARRALSEVVRGIRTMITSAQELEGAVARSRALFGRGAGTRMVQWAMGLSIGTPYQAEQIFGAARMAQALQLGRYANIQDIILRAAGPLSVVFADRLQRGMEDAMYGIGRAVVGGYWRILRRLGITPEDLAAKYGTPMPGTEASRTEAGRAALLRAIMAEVMARYGGAVQEFAGTWQVLLADLKDIWQYFVLRYDWNVQEDTQRQGTITSLIKQLVKGFRDTFLSWMQSGKLDRFIESLVALTSWMQPLVSWIVQHMEPLIDYATQVLDRLYKWLDEAFLRFFGVRLKDLNTPEGLALFGKGLMANITSIGSDIIGILQAGLVLQKEMMNIMFLIADILARLTDYFTKGKYGVAQKVQVLWGAATQTMGKVIGWVGAAGQRVGQWSVYWRREELQEALRRLGYDEPEIQQILAQVDQQVASDRNIETPQQQEAVYRRAVNWALERLRAGEFQPAVPQSFQRGGKVERSGLAYVHRGEVIVPTRPEWEELSPRERERQARALEEAMGWRRPAVWERAIGWLRGHRDLLMGEASLIPWLLPAGAGQGRIPEGLTRAWNWARGLWEQRRLERDIATDPESVQHRLGEYVARYGGPRGQGLSWADWQDALFILSFLFPIEGEVSSAIGVLMRMGRLSRAWRWVQLILGGGEAGGIMGFAEGAHREPWLTRAWTWLRRLVGGADEAQIRQWKRLASQLARERKWREARFFGRRARLAELRLDQRAVEVLRTWLRDKWTWWRRHFGDLEREVFHHKRGVKMLREARLIEDAEARRGAILRARRSELAEAAQAHRKARAARERSIWRAIWTRFAKIRARFAKEASEEAPQITDPELRWIANQLEELKQGQVQVGKAIRRGRILAWLKWLIPAAGVPIIWHYAHRRGEEVAKGAGEAVGGGFEDLQRMQEQYQQQPGWGTPAQPPAWGTSQPLPPPTGGAAGGAPNIYIGGNVIVNNPNRRFLEDFSEAIGIDPSELDQKMGANY